jgi:hypothetical protein
MASSGPDLVRAIVPAFSVGVIIPPATTLGYPGAREVTFTTPDGVRLAAWYVPGHNGAGVILMHGSHGDRTSELPYLRFLAEPATRCLPSTPAGTARAAAKPMHSAGTATATPPAHSAFSPTNPESTRTGSRASDCRWAPRSSSARQRVACRSPP